MSKNVKNTQTQLADGDTTKETVPVVEQPSEQAVSEDPTDVETTAPVEVKPQPKPTKVSSGFSGLDRRLNRPEPMLESVVPPNQVHESIKAKYGIDINTEADTSLMRTLMLDLDDYVKCMHPQRPVNDTQIQHYQNLLIRRINDALNAGPQLGVPAMQIIEEYFTYYSSNVFGHSNPFRGFNMIVTRLQPFQDIVYALQLIATQGKSGAMAKIDIGRLKQACPSPDAQITLLAYLNV